MDVRGSRGTNSSTQLQTTHDPAGFLFLHMLHGYVCVLHAGTRRAYMPMEPAVHTDLHGSPGATVRR